NSACAAAFLAACLGTTALTPAVSLAAPAAEQNLRDFDIAPQPLQSALLEFSRQSNSPVVASTSLLKGLSAPGVQGRMDEGQALNTLLAGSGLYALQSADGGWAISRKDASDPQSGSAAGDGADQGTVAALVVTAQKRQENIQDVPIAISAFTEKALQEQKIEGGFDLLKAIPNVTFSKNNFTGYNFSIRGIGTKAVSATTDPGVAVSFNNASLIQNRLFEQEYFDVERVEVLRGPQGTLYGRNATAGVINVISAKPNLHDFGAWAKGEVGNYNARRVSGMVNVPLVSDKLAIRLAGALTKRDGYDYNATTKNDVNGRDLWSGRITIGFNPTESIRTNLVWERFHEDDNRSRTGKQLCKRDPGVGVIGNTPLGWGPKTNVLVAGMQTSQGCLPVSLYDKDAYQTPNGLSIPFVAYIIFNADYVREDNPSIMSALYPIGYTTPGGPSDGGEMVTFLKAADPYGGMLQTRDLRTFNSIRDPKYRAGADVIQLSMDFDIGEHLTLGAQTTYDRDSVYSFQDYNRFNTIPVIRDTSALYDPWNLGQPSRWANLARNGNFCDPQIGCSNTIAGFDISKANSTQWVQELRLQSSFDGPLNFSAGVNYTKFRVLADYYVFFNLVTAIAETANFNFQGDPTKCNTPVQNIMPDLSTPVVDINSPDAHCPYVDPNPIESINGDGHNYFRSKNPYHLTSSAAFGELYYEVTPEVKITAGLRYTNDRKTFTPVPSQLLLSTSLTGAGDVNRGYPALPDVKQHWGEFTGRLGVDWKPQLSFTDQTMIYAFYSHGYKGGGANPPPVGFTTRTMRELLGSIWFPDIPFDYPIPQVESDTFKPEFVNAFEVGAKNTLFGGALTINGDTFFYDYKDYQVSKVVDRTVSNENFDAKVWGVEFETMFAPSRRMQVIANLGYLDTAIGAGAHSIDVMNRTQGHSDWIVIKPWVQLPSNCIVPVWVAEETVQFGNTISPGLCGGSGLAAWFHQDKWYDSHTGGFYDPANYPEVNGGAGFAQNLKGNELPNSPHWTANVGAQYRIDFAGDWHATVRGDAYWQSQSWARVYNALNDKLHGWYNANLSLWLENEDGVKIEIYAKNILDKSPITDSFINSDDTALTTNVFTLDPRLLGFSVKKEF
ncbi:MAG: TonB-dependent receptor domain-containing protein, partial [Ignavibacteriales bacterium]